MNCFYHSERSAVGFCKSCQKALCYPCAAVTAKGLACVGHCEDDVRALDKMMDAMMDLEPDEMFHFDPPVTETLNWATLGIAFFAIAFLHWSHG